MSDHDPLCPMALSRRAKRCTCMELHKRDTRVRADERERIAQEIEAERNNEWQVHLREHMPAKCPRCYGRHDAFYRAARIARGES